MPPKTKFTEGEKVLCFHGPLIYEAKALKYQILKDKQVKYFIHYAGWNKNWDEWVPENRVLKYNDANVQRQKEVSQLHANAAGKNKKASSKKGKGDKDNSDSRASTPSKETAAQSSAVSSSTSAGSTTGSSSEESKQNATGGGGGTTTPTPATGSRASTPSGQQSASAQVSSGIVGGSGGAGTGGAGTGASTNNSRRSLSSKETSNGTEKSSTVANSSSNSGGGGGGATATGEPPRKKRGGSRLDPTIESEEQFITKVEVKIKIPDELKPWLVNDWDAVTKQHKLVELPVKTTVQDIIDGYVQYKKSTKAVSTQKEPQILEVANGLVEYFNVTLGSQLLYKFERPQYAEILEKYPNKPLSAIYGAVHLLRLFIKLGSMLAFTALDEKTIQLLLVHIHDFLKHLTKNSATLFSMQHFVNSSPEYHRKAQ